MRSGGRAATRAPGPPAAIRPGISVVRCAPELDTTAEFARAVALGLSERPRWLPCRFLYDAEGSRLFEKICETPEYYLTRTETSLLAEHADGIARLTGPRTLVELGSGNGRKTDLLLSAYERTGGPVRYVPVDVSEQALRASARELSVRHPLLSVHALYGTYEHAFPLFEPLSPLLLLFLGSTIGNFNQTESATFWSRVAHTLAPGDFVLLGADLIKNPAVLNAAYNDAAGWSAAFTVNLFARMNLELGSAVDLAAIRHEAAYREDWARVEIFARLTRRQEVHLAPLRRTITLRAGERIMTEISRKYDLAELASYLAGFGLEPVRTYTDPERWYALLLVRRV